MAENPDQPRRNSIAGGVIYNWLGQLVFALSGFVLPRMISDRLGQESLGLWDFAWSLVVYTSLLGFGVTAAASRYVAHYRELRDWISLSRVVTSCAALLSLACLVGTAMVAVLVVFTPQMVRIDDAARIGETQWLVAFLGLSGAVLLPLSLFNAILTGCQRFDLKNSIRCVVHLLGFAVMAALLYGGLGLISMALTYLLAEVITGLVNLIVSRRLCPELRIGPSFLRMAEIREVLAFGVKSMLQPLANMGLYQTSSLIVAFYLGPVVLAVYSRQRALLAFARQLLDQYSRVFVPAGSILNAKNDLPGLREMAIQSGRYGFYIVLPIVAVLTIAGGPLVRLWMGPEYEAPLVMGILAVGHLLSLALRGPYRLLIGMNKHGWASLAEVFGAIFGTALGFLFVGVLDWGLVGASSAVALAVTIGGGFVPAMRICHLLDIKLTDYVSQVLLKPLVAVSPLVACLFLAKLVSGGSALWELAIGVGGGGALLVWAYWRVVLPVRVKQSLRQRLKSSRLGRYRKPAKGHVAPVEGP